MSLLDKNRNLIITETFWLNGFVVPAYNPNLIEEDLKYLDFKTDEEKEAFRLGWLSAFQSLGVQEETK